MGFSNSGKNRRRKNNNGRDEDSNVNATNIPNSRELVQRMKEIVNCSEQEAYTMLMKCAMDPEEAVNRLLNQAKDTPEFVLTSLQQLSIENDEPKTSVKELEHLRFGSGMNGSGQPDGLSSQLLKKLALFEEDQRIRRNTANDLRAHQMNSNAARNYHSSSNYDQREPTQDNQKKSSSATDFTFDFSQLFNHVMAPSEPSLQSQNFNTFPNPMYEILFDLNLHLFWSYVVGSTNIHRDLGRWITATVNEAMASARKPQMNGQAMNQQAYTREQDPQYSASPLNQSMSTAYSHGRRPSASEIEMNGEAMNQQAYTRELNPQYSASPLNQSMPTATSHGRSPSASEIDALIQQSINQQAYKREPDLPQSAVPVVPSANGSAYGFGMSSDNAANSRFGSDDVLRPQLGNHLPSFQHQNKNSNVLAPQGHQNDQSPSLRHSQQQEQEQEQEQQPYRGSGNGTERSRRYQRNNRRDSSNQTQQKTWRRRNNN